MQGSLSATQDQIAWVLTSYLIAVAVATPLWGALGQTFGRKPSAVALDRRLHAVFRSSRPTPRRLKKFSFTAFMQGLFGASLIPLALSSLLAIYRREDIGIAMGWWGVGIMFGPVFGPTIGGYLVEYSNWRWAFYLNIPVCMSRRS